MLWREAGIDTQQEPETGEQQTGADQQHECQPDLRDDEPSANAARASPRRAAPALVAEHGAQVQACELHRRHRANHESEHERQAENEEEDVGVEPDLVASRDLGQADGRQPAQTPPPEREPDDGAGNGEHHRLGYELARHPPTGRSERMARGHLLEPAARANQGEIGDVDGRDEQHEQRPTPEQIQHSPDVSDDVRFERHNDGVESGVHECGFEGPGPFDDPLVQGINPCPCLLRRGAHREPANHLMVLAVARFLRTGLCIERQRREDAHVRIEEREALRQNADDEIRLVVQPQGSADDGVDSAGLLGRQRYG